MTRFLQRFLNVRREEIALLLASTFFFFCILTAIMVLRPARDALGMRRGMDDVQWLFIGTAVVTLAVNPVFGWLVSRYRRIAFITLTYAFFTASLIGFYALLTFTPQAVGEVSGRIYYVWHSVFNLFCTAVFWALMVDRFTLEQSKRLFGAIAVGGTLGAIAGPWLAGGLLEGGLAQLLLGPLKLFGFAGADQFDQFVAGLPEWLSRPWQTPSLLLVAAGFLVTAVVAAWVVAWLQPERSADEPAADDRAIIGGSAWEGIRAVFRSRYLLGISGYMLLAAVTMTYLYFTRLRMVEALGSDLDERTKIFANLDLITQVTTLALQLVVAGHFMKRFGVSAALIALPVVVAFGFVGLALVGTYAALVVFEATFRAGRYAIMQPARHTLFTVVSREEKYKSKAFTDTFVSRGGDVIGAWTQGLLVGGLGPRIASVGIGLTASLAALAAVAVPLAAVWALLGLWLGRQQIAMAAADPPQHQGENAG